MGDHDFHLSVSLNLKPTGAVGLPTYDLILVSSTNRMPVSHSLTVQNSSFPLSLGQKFGPPPHSHANLADSFKIKSSPTENEVVWFVTS